MKSLNEIKRNPFCQPGKVLMLFCNFQKTKINLNPNPSTNLIPKNAKNLLKSSSRKFYAKESDHSDRRSSSLFSVSSSYIVDLLKGPTAEVLPDSVQHQMRRVSLHGKVIRITRTAFSIIGIINFLSWRFFLRFTRSLVPMIRKKRCFSCLEILCREI